LSAINYPEIYTNRRCLGSVGQQQRFSYTGFCFWEKRQIF